MATSIAAPKDTTSFKAFLLDQMVSVAKGDQEPATAKAICNYAQQIYNVCNLEMKYAAHKYKLGDAVVKSVTLIGR